ncbi:MAG: caspase family protein, partial [Proteobacteria bacterium]|nr:caspase family protein [Pseudomonadota bacterium]
MSKLALIIGNADYPESPLSNPANDARAIKERLARLGFTTITRIDAEHKTMDLALQKFSKRLANQEVALFFFAGHGMQIEGEHFLTAVDTDFDDEIDAKHSSLSLNKVIDVMERVVNKTDIIILDACRTNPYERRWRGVDSRGLAPVYAPKGMIIGYATSPGQVA